jgi:hypothetical protein
MQLVAGPDALDRGDPLATQRRGEGQARHHTPAVDVHSAGAALATIAALLGPRQLQTFPQRVQQCDPRVDTQRLRLAVDETRDLDQTGVRRRLGRGDRPGKGDPGRHHGRPAEEMPPGQPITGFHRTSTSSWRQKVHGGVSRVYPGDQRPASTVTRSDLCQISGGSQPHLRGTGRGGDGLHGPAEYVDITTIQPYYQALKRFLLP